VILAVRGLSSNPVLGGFRGSWHHPSVSVLGIPLAGVRSSHGIWPWLSYSIDPAMMFLAPLLCADQCAWCLARTRARSWWTTAAMKDRIPSTRYARPGQRRGRSRWPRWTGPWRVLRHLNVLILRAVDRRCGLPWQRRMHRERRLAESSRNCIPAVGAEIDHSRLRPSHGSSANTRSRRAA